MGVEIPHSDTTFRFEVGLLVRVGTLSERVLQVTFLLSVKNIFLEALSKFLLSYSPILGLVATRELGKLDSGKNKYNNKYWFMAVILKVG